MNAFNTVKTFFSPEQQRRVSMAVLFALNSAIIGLARRQMSLNRKDSALFLDGNTPGDRFAADSIDANVRDLEIRRAKNNAGSGNTNPHADGGTSDAVLEEQGFSVENPAKQAENFVALRTLVLLETNDLIKANHLNPLQDQSIARQILWQLDLPYRENTSKIVEAVAASNGRASIDIVRKALHDDWLSLQKQRKELAPELIVTAESFLSADIDDSDSIMTAARFYESHLNAFDRLRVLNAMWSKSQKFIQVDLPSGKLPTMNMAAEIGVISQAMGELEREASVLLDECIPEYIATYIDRGFAGLPVIVHLEERKKQKAHSAASSLMNMSSDLEAVLHRTAELRRHRMLVKQPTPPAETTPPPAETTPPPAETAPAT